MNQTTNLTGPYGRCHKCNVVWAMEGRALKAKRHGMREGTWRRCPDCRCSLYQTELALRLRIRAALAGAFAAGEPDVRPWQYRDQGGAR